MSKKITFHTDGTELYLTSSSSTAYTTSALSTQLTYPYPVSDGTSVHYNDSIGTSKVTVAVSSARGLVVHVEDVVPATSPEFGAHVVVNVSNQERVENSNQGVLPVGQAYLYYPSHLSRWRQRLADFRYRQAVISVSGNSLVKGQYSNNSSGTDEVTWRARGWVPQLRDSIALRTGISVGEGVIQNNDVRVAAVGASNNTSLGVSQQGRRLDSNSDTLTYTLPACTDIKIYWWWQDNASCAPFTYTIDGGDPATAASGSGSDQYLTETITGLANTTHTLVITGPAGPSKVADISAVGAYTATSSGVVVNRLHSSGGYLDNLFIAGTGTSATRVKRLTTTHIGTDLLIIQMGQNESSTTGQGLGYTPTSFASLMAEVVDYQTNTNNGSVLIVAGPRRDPTGIGAAYTEDAYYDAVKAVAAANQHCAFLDLRQAFGPYSAANSNGLMQDVVHPNRTGHSLIHKVVLDSIFGA